MILAELVQNWEEMETMAKPDHSGCKTSKLKDSDLLVLKGLMVGR